MLTKIRRYVANGGGFLGIGNPSGYFYQGKYFQLSDILGVEKELGFTYCKNKFFPEENKKHWIISDTQMKNVHFVPCHQMVYPTGAEVLCYAFNENDPTQNTNQGGNVRLAVHEYGKGRAVYLSGLFDSFDAFRLIYKSLLWASHKEADYQKALSSNPNVDCYYYENTDSYALLNNIGEEEKTIFYDIHGKPSEMTLKGHETRWIAKE